MYLLMLVRRAPLLAPVLLAGGCWMARIGPCYEYTTESTAWHAPADLRAHSVWRLDRAGLQWGTTGWGYRSSVLVLEVANTGADEQVVRLHGPVAASYGWHLGRLGDSDPGPMHDARFGADRVTIPGHKQACLTLKLEDLRGGTPTAREGDRLRFAIEDALGRLDCEFRLERIRYDYRLLPVLGD